MMSWEIVKLPVVAAQQQQHRCQIQLKEFSLTHEGCACKLLGLNNAQVQLKKLIS